ncbi:hypothetical protein VdG1_04905 [Verticillium dahliae VDG1]|nr:hypothetical protein VdG1_04905 [Verticillium dahliae VDG1]
MLSHYVTLLAVYLMPVLAAPQAQGLDKRAVSCLSVGATATARWTNAAGQNCTFTGVVGSNYGANGAGAGDGGASDPNCGAAYNAAVDDTAFGTLNGCGRTNPSNAVSKPSTRPGWGYPNGLVWVL